MGIEIAFGIASLAVGVISGLNQMSAAAETTKATERAIKKEKQAVAAQKEVKNIQLAQQKIVGLEDRRQRVREERIRRAAMLTASEHAGGAGGSGEAGAVSALGANLGALISFQSGESRANTGVNTYNQKALDLSTEGSAIMARARARAGEADAFSSFLGVFSSGFSTAGSIFSQG
jgi:hypothetical protein